MAMQRVFSFSAALLLWAVALVSHAQSDPRQLVIDSVDRMVERIDAEREALEADPEKARQLVREELVDLVDFKRITRMVMGEYFDPSSREQKYRFLDVFKNSLINTYAAGITLYDGQKITTLPMQDEDRKGDYARVRMEVRTNSGTVVPIVYTLFQRDDQWRVINVMINGLDLRDTFKNQFAQAMEQYGDVDAVIDNWAAGTRLASPLNEQQSES